MSKLPYWKRRMLQVSQLQDEKTQTYIAQMTKDYERLSKSISSEIKTWVERYADNDQISAAEVRQQLSKKERQSWSMRLDEFREKAIDGGYDQELNREYFKSRITRLEQLQSQLYFELAEEGKKQNANLEKYLSEMLDDSYMRYIYEFTDRGAFAINFGHYSNRALKIAIMKPWKGGNFSQRVWGNHLDRLPDKLQKTMTLAITQGWGVNRTVEAMMEGVDKTLKTRMVTLVQTESAHLAEVANEKAMEETGVEKWEWLATLESHTCERCAGLDGQEFDLGDETAPECPDHPNCRCTRVPALAGWKSASRWQRDPETGKGDVSKNQTFDEWKESQNTPASLQNVADGINLETANSSDIIKLGKMFEEKYKVSEAIGNKAKLKNIFSNYREMGGKVPGAAWFSKSNSKTKSQLQEAFSFYPKQWANYIADNDKKIFAGKSTRGFFSHEMVTAKANFLSGTKRGDGISIYSSGTRKTTAYHEIGHMVDHFNSNLIRIEKDFIAKRTAAENFTRLNVIFPYNGYGNNEVTKKDNFISPYIGKDYGNRATEVFSMGLESIFEPEDGFVKGIENGEAIYAKITDDMEYLHLIIGLILKG
ncbi:minor capsid protein [Enterococcus timonensis]|uniref:minor capsid protein n=1 Tax=Enterococcus timonensis TaxID=1852364 RepID=UPI0008D93472|nr:minor capsid protein [Enterococcus timonensis]